MADAHADCKGLSCPMPIVEISRAVKVLGPGQTLSVEADDPAFKADLEAWVSQMGHTLVEFDDGDVQRAIIQKA